MTSGWTGTDLAAGDVAWHAWHRLGVDAMVVLDRTVPPTLQPLADALGPVMADVTRQVLDEAEVRIYGEARERIVATAQQGMVHHAIYAVIEAVRRELMRPDPVPFVPPPAGSWIRARWSDRGRGAQWDGRWHLFTGDMRLRPEHVNRVETRSRCGVQVRLRDPDVGSEAVIAEMMPGVDVCGRCSRLVAMDA